MSAAPRSTYMATSEGLTQKKRIPVSGFSKMSLRLSSFMPGQPQPARSNMS